MIFLIWDGWGGAGIFIPTDELTWNKCINYLLLFMNINIHLECFSITLYCTEIFSSKYILISWISNIIQSWLKLLARPFLYNNVKTAEPIRPKFCVRVHMTPGVGLWMQVQNCKTNFIIVSSTRKC